MMILAIAIGGFGGAIMRYAVISFVKKRTKRDFPVGTWLVNLTGSFLLGVFVGKGLNGAVYALLGTGFCGAFTTFSTFKLELVQLWRNQNKKIFSAYLVSSYVLGLFAAWLGFMVGN